VQQALLKILESTICSVPPQGGRKHPQQEYIKVDTTDILFICGGAFGGLERLVERRLGRDVMGFGAVEKQHKTGAIERDQLLTHVEPEDLLSFGFIPEFVGRLPMITTLAALTEEQLVQVLTEPKNALTRQYAKLLGMDGVDVEFQAEALMELASQAMNKGTGTRALRSLMEKLMLDLMYDLPGRDDISHVTITREMVRSEGEAKLRLREKKEAA